jgi:hypothetical protein
MRTSPFSRKEKCTALCQFPLGATEYSRAGCSGVNFVFLTLKHQGKAKILFHILLPAFPSRSLQTNQINEQNEPCQEVNQRLTVVLNGKRKTIWVYS